MEDQAKIEEMLRQGKIDSEQAALLIAALRDSGHREESFGEQFRRQKSERIRTGWRLVCIWLTAGAILTGGLILAVGRPGLSRDEITIMTCPLGTFADCRSGGVGPHGRESAAPPWDWRAPVRS